MSESQTSNLLDGISMITKKERQFIRSTLMKTDKTLNELRNNDAPQQGRSRIFRKSEPKKHSLQKVQLTTIDKHYTFLLKCVEIKLNYPYNIFLQPHTQEYFTFDMDIHVFPLILQVNKICSQGFLFIGFNQQYPGLQRTARNNDPMSQKKIPLNKIQNIQIQQPGNKNIHKLYFLFTSYKKSLTLSFKFSSSINGSTASLPQKTKKNFFDVIDQKLNAPVRKFRVKTQTSPKFSMTKASYLEKLQRISIDQNFTTFTSKFTALNDSKLNSEDLSQLKKLTKSILFNQSTSMKSLTQQNFGLNRNLSKTQYKNESITSFLRKNVSFSNEEKRLISQKNLLELQLYKQKTQKLLELVQRFKGQILTMKKQHDQNRLKQKKILKNVTIILKLCKFSQKSQKAFIKRQKTLSKFFKTVVNVIKFIQKLKNQRLNSQKLVSQTNARIVYGLLPLTQLLSVSIWERADDNAQKTLSKTFVKLFSCFLSRQLIERSQIYLKKVTKIQIMYRERLRAQKRMLSIYSFKMVEKLIKKFPHFKKFENSFREQNVNEKLISQYLKDENLKFNERVMNYKRQLNEREEFIKMKLMNHKKKESPNKLKRRSLTKYDNKMEKTQLQIPLLAKKTCRNLFINLNILQTMIRNWFELQKQMWKKKEKAKKEWL